MLIRLTFGALVPFPRRRKVRAALATTEWNWLYAILFVFIEDLANTLLQAQQTDELGIGRVGYKVHLRWRWFRWGNLQKKKPFLDWFSKYIAGFSSLLSFAQSTLFMDMWA